MEEPWEEGLWTTRPRIKARHQTPVAVGTQVGRSEVFPTPERPRLDRSIPRGKVGLERQRYVCVLPCICYPAQRAMAAVLFFT